MKKKQQNETWTRAELAAILNGREYGSEITKEEEAKAKESGLVVVFGYSDDNAELRGAINDEVGIWDDGEFKIDNEGIVKSWEQVADDGEEAAEAYFKRKAAGFATIRYHWGLHDFSWVFGTDILHTAFDIMEGDEKYCRGIVFAIADLGKKEPSK